MIHDLLLLLKSLWCINIMLHCKKKKKKMLCLSGCSIWHVPTTAVHVGFMIEFGLRYISICFSVTHLFCYFMLPGLLKAKWHKKMLRWSIKFLCNKQIEKVISFKHSIPSVPPQTHTIGFNKIHFIIFIKYFFKFVLPCFSWAVKY